ncbi:TPA: hypothetical protein ACXJMC_002673 [Pseudomonas aeruginosa]
MTESKICTCPSGDGSLRHPCPAHPAVEQAGGDERAAFEAWATHLPMDRQPLRPDLYMPQTQWAWEAWQFRAALAQPSQSQYEASFEEWLANELEGEDGQPVPAAVCDIALARRAFNHWPKLEHPAKVGGVRFSAGVSSRLVVEAAQRLYEFESTPEKEAERIERLQAFREQLDPLNLAPHAEAFNEAPADALRPEQAEAERPEVAEVAFVLRNIGAMDAEDIDGDNVDLRFEDAEGRDTGCDVSIVEYAEKAADLFEQHDRIVGELRADRDSWAEQAEQRLADWDEMRKERDAALARVAELEMLLRKLSTNGLMQFSTADEETAVQAALGGAPVAQAQHSVPDHAELLQALERTHAGHMVGHDQSDQPKGGYSDGYVNGFGECIKVARKVLAAAPSHSTPVPQAWIDVLAERRRQVEAEGWTPEHDDEHDNGEMARAAACYALAGSSAPNDGTAALLVSLAWPWDQQWWKPTSARRDLVKACALALAEIERLDRAGISQSPQPGATTASS